MSFWDWVALVILVPLVAWGWWLKYARWQERRRKLARERDRFLKELRAGTVRHTR